jgi:hypothetical protein
MMNLPAAFWLGLGICEMLGIISCTESKYLTTAQRDWSQKQHLKLKKEFINHSCACVVSKSPTEMPKAIRAFLCHRLMIFFLDEFRSVKRPRSPQKEPISCPHINCPDIFFAEEMLLCLSLCFEGCPLSTISSQLYQRLNHR